MSCRATGWEGIRTATWDEGGFAWALDVECEDVYHDARCADSHEDPRRAPAAIQQKDAFFRPDGKITDTCDGRPCVAPNRFSLDY